MNTEPISIGVIGCGVMGSGMARNLASHGHTVYGFSRTKSKVERLHDVGVISAPLRQIAAECSYVLLSLSDGASVEELLFGDSTKFAANLKPGSLIIDTTTIAPAEASTLADKSQAIGLGFIDAPVSGGDIGARDGTLTIMCGGSEELFAQALPILRCIGSRITLIGPSGSGQKMKAVNQVAVALGIVAMTEAMVFAHDQGVDLSVALDVLGGGAANSWALSHYAPRLLKDDMKPGFSAIHMLKDLKIAQREATGLTELPGLDLVTTLFEKLVSEEKGVGNHALIKAYKPFP